MLGTFFNVPNYITVAPHSLIPYYVMYAMMHTYACAITLLISMNLFFAKPNISKPLEHPFDWLMLLTLQLFPELPIKSYFTLHSEASFLLDNCKNTSSNSPFCSLVILFGITFCLAFKHFASKASLQRATKPLASIFKLYGSQAH